MAAMKVKNCRRFTLCSLTIANSHTQYAEHSNLSKLEIAEVHVIQINGIRLLLVVPVELVVDRDAIPVGCGRWVVPIQRMGYAVERDRLVEKLIVCCALHLNDEVVPTIAHRVARNSCGDPMRSEEHTSELQSHSFISY